MTTLREHLEEQVKDQALRKAWDESELSGQKHNYGDVS